MLRAFRTMLLAVALGAGTATAQDLEEATNTLESGDAAKAIQQYEAATGDQTNGHLFYNLGIAYYREGRLPEAVAAFLGARRLLPRDPDVAANLRYVLAKIPDKLEADVHHGISAPVALILDRVTLRELFLGFAFLTGILGLAFAFTLWQPQQAALRRPILAGLLAPVALLILMSLKATSSDVWGAAYGAPKIMVYSGPGEQNTTLFELHPGAPVQIVERGKSGFLKIQISDGKTGWAQGSQVKVMGQPFGATL